MNKEQRDEILQLVREQTKIVDLLETQQHRINRATVKAGIGSAGNLHSVRRAVASMRAKVALPTGAQRRVLRVLSKTRKAITTEAIAKIRIADARIRGDSNYLLRQTRGASTVLVTLERRALVESCGPRWSLRSSKWRLTKAGRAYVKAFC